MISGVPKVLTYSLTRNKVLSYFKTVGLAQTALTATHINPNVTSQSPTEE